MSRQRKVEHCCPTTMSLPSLSLPCHSYGKLPLPRAPHPWLPVTQGLSTTGWGAVLSGTFLFEKQCCCLKPQPLKPVAKFIVCYKLGAGISPRLSVKTSTPPSHQARGPTQPLFFLPRWCRGVGRHNILGGEFLLHCSNISTSAPRENSD